MSKIKSLKDARQVLLELDRRANFATHVRAILRERYDFRDWATVRWKHDLVWEWRSLKQAVYDEVGAKTLNDRKALRSILYFEVGILERKIGGQRFFLGMRHKDPAKRLSPSMSWQLQ